MARHKYLRSHTPSIVPSAPCERSSDGSYPGGHTYTRDQNPTCGQAEALQALMRRGLTKIVWVETPSNPMCAVQDRLPVRRLRTQLVIDSTVATPVLCQPLALGADFRHASGNETAQRPLGCACGGAWCAAETTSCGRASGTIRACRGP